MSGTEDRLRKLVADPPRAMAPQPLIMSPDNLVNWCRALKTEVPLTDEETGREWLVDADGWHPKATCVAPWRLTPNVEEEDDDG